ncbi:hypothetical protein [Pseudalkalibacillus caeni]|nr:hypothetical protein [Pseudalkalibacillus caeni]
MWFRFIVIGLFSLTAVSLMVFQSIEIVSAFVSFYIENRGK